MLALVAALAVLSGTTAQAPPNAVAFTDFSVITGTWSGMCTQSAYVSGDIPDAAACAISLNQIFSYPFTVTFSGAAGYSVSMGTFSNIGQNETFSAGRVTMTNYPISKSGTATTPFEDAFNGGSRLITVPWGGGSASSTFMATLTKGFGGYGTYLEEGLRSFSVTELTSATLPYPSNTNLPHQCIQGRSYPSNTIPTKYSYTCYAIIKAPIFD